MAFFMNLPQKPDIGSILGEGLGQGISHGLQEQVGSYFGKRRQERALEDFFSSEQGQRLSGEEKSLISGYTKGLLPPQALSKVFNKIDPNVEAENVEIMKNAFGEDFANIWKATGQGERTALTNAALDAKLRGVDIRNLLGELKGRPTQPQLTDENLGVEAKYDTPQGDFEFKEDVEFPSYQLDSSGKTPKELNTYRSQLRKENAKPYATAVEEYKNLKKEQGSIHNLKTLNKREDLPSTFVEKLSKGINPFTGKIFLPSRASPAVELWEKTINNFTTQAKNSFGARVTNFELERFLARLPRLINSRKGRELILEQMDLINQIDALESKSREDTYEHYKLDNITPEDATRIARQRIEKPIASLIEKFNKIDDRIDALASSSGNNQFQKGNFPSPAENEGRIIRLKSGERFKSDGQSWRKIQ